MPTLSPSAVHIDGPLTSVAIAYRQSAARFVASRVFPQVSVTKQSDKYWIFDRDAMNRRKMRKRAPATESAGTTLSLSQDSYFAEKWALHYDVADETRANADPAINIDAMTTEQLAMDGLLEKEAQFAERFMVPGVWGRDITGVSATPTGAQVMQWNDDASTPVEDIRAEATRIQGVTGFRPNKLVLGQQVKDELVSHPDIIDRIKYSSSNDNPAIVNDSALAKLFDVEEVLTMGAVLNSAAEGATESNNFIGGKTALLTYTPATASSMMPSAGMVFNWTTYLGNSPQGIRVKRFRMEALEADRVEAEMFYDMKATGLDLSALFASIVA